MKTSALRSLSLLSLASAALSASAADAFSSLDPAPGAYVRGGVSLVGDYTVGNRFTSSATGTLTGLQVAMNNLVDMVPTAYTVRLYADSGTNTLGELLGTYSGTSTGISAIGTSSALSSVAVTGSAPTLVSGKAYWLVASAQGSLGWNLANTGQTRVYVDGSGVSNEYFDNDIRNAFSVQVDPIFPTVSGPAAALPFVLMALKRRKRA